MIVAGFVVAPLSAAILILVIRPRLVMVGGRKQLWTVLALAPLAVLGAFLVNVAVAFVFVRLLFADGLD